MISILREFTKSWIFTLLMGLLIASFAVFGLRDVFSNVGDNAVIIAGKRQMDVAEFKKRYDDYKQQAAKAGQVFTNDDFVAAGHDVEMLNAYAKQEAFAAWLDQLGIKPSDKMVVDELAKIPAFVNAVTGKFDKETYLQRLRDNNYDQKDFEQQTSDEIATQQYMQAAMAGLHAPRIYAASEAALLSQTRDATFFVVSDKNVPPPPVPTDADIQAYYKQNAAQLQQPEIRQASVIQFAPAVFAAKIPVSEDDIQKAYQFRLDSLGTPETRTFTVVTAPDAATAAKISAGLKAGGDAASLAKANKGQVIDNVDKPKTAITDTKVRDAAFAMHTGDISGAIQGDLGYAVIKMGEIKIGSTPSLASVHDQLKSQIQQDRAADKVNEVVNAFQKAHDSGEDFATTAKNLGLDIQPLPAMSADGKVFDPKTGAPAIDPNTHQQVDYSKGMPPQVLKDIFDLTPGGTSDVEELGSGMYVALRLDGVRAAGLPPLDAGLKAELTGAWQGDKVVAAVTAKAEEVTQRLNNGETLAKVAAEIKAPVQTLPGVDQMNSPRQMGQMGQQIVSRVFATETGQSFQVQVGQAAFVIGHVDAVHQGDPAKVNAVASTVGDQMTQTIAKDIAELTQDGAIAAVKAKTYPAVADRALDVKPATGAASSSKAKP